MSHINQLFEINVKYKRKIMLTGKTYQHNDYEQHNVYKYINWHARIININIIGCCENGVFSMALHIK